MNEILEALCIQGEKSHKYPLSSSRRMDGKQTTDRLNLDIPLPQKSKESLVWGFLSLDQKATINAIYGLCRKVW